METVVANSTAEQYIYRTRLRVSQMLLLDPQNLGTVTWRLNEIERELVLALAALKEAVAVGSTDTFADEASRIADIIDRQLPDQWPNDINIDMVDINLERVVNQIKGLIERVNQLRPPVEEDGPLAGLEEDVQLLTSRLIAGELTRQVVSIVGMAGIGKTALVKKVYHSPVVVRQFPRRAWVTAPHEYEPNSLSLKIAIQALPIEQLTSLWSEEKLTQLFLRGERYLIVLDDVRTAEALNNVERLLPQNSNRSRIVITTRSRDLVDPGPNCSILEKRALSDEEGWELFNTKLGFSVPVELKGLGQEILKKCAGFPRFISAVADILSKKAVTQEQWSVALQQINYDQVFPVADALPSNLKQCLYYFGLFHEACEIPTRRLIVLWVAEGLAQHEKGNKEPPELVAEKLLKELVQQNMIQVAKWKLNGKVKTCRLNYFLRNNWLSKAEEFFNAKGRFLRLADHLDRKDECFSHIHGNDSISGSSLKAHYRDLHALLSFDSREGPVPGEDIGNFLGKCIAGGCFKMLRVIDLEGVFRPKLPNSMGKLIQLRYLGLRWTYLETLPSSVWNLLNLQTLDLKHTYISSLPSSLWKMQQLRHLYLSESYRSRFVPPPSTNSLIDIQTLWGAFVDEETPIKDCFDRLINLRKLGLACRLTSSQWKALAEWINKLEHLESLRLRSINEMVQPSNLLLEPLSGLKKLSSIYLFGRLDNPVVLGDFPESLTEVTLSVSGILEDPMPTLEKLPHLRILNLFAGSYIGKIMFCSSGGFPLLQVLKLWKLEELEEWIVEEGAMKILREVEVRSCNKLKMIPDGLKHLVHCREMKLSHMPDEFKERVIQSQGQDWYKIAHVPSIVFKD